ncbi:hypothetical protein [Burkholderia anthina]|uniref:hypothetical protein n=1 Tax=Burkholderia anthina TaxID=179879 RepID=UPI0037BE259F
MNLAYIMALFTGGRSVQHEAMFGCFLDGLTSRGVTLATFGDADLDAFLGRASGRFKTGTTDLPVAPLFPGGRVPRRPPRTLDRIVKEALITTDFVGPDMSPRVLRNTYARRHLLGGRTNAEVTASLGLVSERTVTRIRATIGRGSSGRGM